MFASKSPVPYFDTLEAMRNPFKEPVSSLDHLMPDPPADALLDYHTPVNLFTATAGPDTFSNRRKSSIFCTGAGS